MSTKAILAGIAGAVFNFAGGFLLYGLLLADYYSSNMTVYEGLVKDPPDMIALSASCLGWSFLFAFIYSKWTQVKSFGAGFTSGLVPGFLLMLLFDASFYAFYNLYPLSFLVIDLLIGTVFVALTAGVVGLVLGMGKKEG